MANSINNRLPMHFRPTLDPKFLFVLFLIEIGSLVFNSLHLTAPEFQFYTAYNELPAIYEIASQPYSCFANINYCVYEQKQLFFLKALDLVFISIIVLCYGFLFIIILFKWEKSKIRSNIKITWYAAFELSALLTLSLHTLVMIILFERNTINTDQCNKQNRLIRAENIFNYFVLSILEVAYIGFDLVNRQTASHQTSDQELQLKPAPAEHQHLHPSQNDQAVLKPIWDKKDIRTNRHFLKINE
ncbi:unnamed protein product [Adineta steineri]|uniref:Uncharacterized protein n=2 Tax=Adineta steineri TaxID=433720 RepID=A0A819I1F0_9BILA|nr:unnamed protein product [Adineta steineri]